MVTINVNQRITGNSIIAANQVICQRTRPDTIRASLPRDGVGVFRYQWQISRDRRTWTNIPNSNSRNLIPEVLDTTSFYRRIVSNLCFSDTSTSERVRVLPLPRVNAGRDTIINVGFSIYLKATGAVSYRWSPAEGLDNVNSPTPLANPNTTTQYIVEGTDVSGCTNRDTVMVIVSDRPVVKVVDIITPNGDGKNDFLYVEGLDRYPDNTIIVFNRHGKEVYRKQNYTNDWDGTFQGDLLPVGVYYYIIKFGVTTWVVNGSVSILY